MPTRQVGDQLHEELDNGIELKVITKCPTKWLLYDQETGQMYRGNNNTDLHSMWTKIKDKDDKRRRTEAH
jgi:hypothetical protein